MGKCSASCARLGLGVAALVVALLLAEAAARLHDRSYCVVDFQGAVWEPHPLYGWAHTPGASGWVKRCLAGRKEFEVFAQINGLGLRDREIPYARTGAYRILLLGDSFTEGLQVELTQTFGRRLEACLEAVRPGDRRVEVINGGTSGYATDNELFFYRYEGRKYHPDLVLLMFDAANDVAENDLELLDKIALYGPTPDKPHFRVDGGRLVLERFPLPPSPWPLPWLQRLHGVLMRHSVLYRLARSVPLPHVPRMVHAAATSTPPPSMLGVLLKRYPPEWEEAWRITRGLVRRLRRDVAHDGAGFAVVVVPAAYEVSEARWRQSLFLQGQTPWVASFDVLKAHELSIRFLRRRRIEHVDLLAGFRAHLVSGTSGYYPLDPHWDAVGHALAADLVARALREKGMVPGDGPG